MEQMENGYFDGAEILIWILICSGIIAGVASKAITIAVATSHSVDKISHCGAHYIVPDLDCVHAFVNKDGSLRIGESLSLVQD